MSLVMCSKFHCHKGLNSTPFVMRSQEGKKAEWDNINPDELFDTLYAYVDWKGYHESSRC